MYTREEASQIKQEFWTAFGKYMNPIPSAEGMKINWVNYHTRIKDVHFRMNADQKSASICILIQHNDPEIQELYYDQFLELKDLLHSTLEEEWQWQLRVIGSDGRVVTKICQELPEVSVFNREHWPELISFFKQRMIALDSFWENARYSFDALK